MKSSPRKVFSKQENYDTVFLAENRWFVADHLSYLGSVFQFVEDKRGTLTTTHCDIFYYFLRITSMRNLISCLGHCNLLILYFID